MRHIATGIAVLAAVLAVPFGLSMAVPSGASAAAGLTAAFAKSWDWGSGYEASYTVTNHGATPVAGWTVAFDLPAGQQMGTYWDALETASGNHYTFTNRNYDGDVPAGGGTVSFGFIVASAGNPGSPANCTVNGGPCGGSGRPAPVIQAATSITNLPSPVPSPLVRTSSRPAAPAPAGTPHSGGSNLTVAPYVDMTNAQEAMLDRAADAGLKAFTAAFVTGAGCTPIWGDTLPVTNDPTVTGEITRAESEGATPIVSFGGEAGTELASSCSNLGQLVAAYQSVIHTLHVTHIDFDIEGAQIAFTASNQLRFQAINKLEAADPGLTVSLTIPVVPTGPDSNGQAFLRQAHADGTRVSVVNVMAMDYYGAVDSAHVDMGTAAVQAAQNTLSFLRTVFRGATYAMVGVTPMIGQNDDPAEVFSEADARTLVSFGEHNHLGRLAFWSADRDQPCAGASGLSQCSEISQQPLDFTKIFDVDAG